jgi:glycosyltransferase involved in cell wall biosynthesis
MDPDPKTEPRRGLLVLDAAYSLESIRQRQAEHTILCRDLDGWFDHVWSVHPMVGADPGDVGAVGRPFVTELAVRHTVIEGHVMGSERLRRVPPLNFVVGQALLLPSLVRLMRSGRVTAIRVGDPYYLGLLGLMLGRIGKAPVIVRVNGNYDAVFARTGRPAFPRLFRYRKFEKVLERFVLRRADFVTAGNRNNLDFAIANGADARRTAVFPYGNLIDPAHFVAPSTRGPRPADAPAGRFCVAVTRLEPVKRVDDVVRAFAAAHATAPDLRLVLIGDGSQRDDLAALAQQLGVLDAVDFAGERPQSWMADVLPHASAIFAASAGRALVEAALSGAPVVAYDDDWHGELIHDGETGRLVPVGDVDGLAAAVSDLLADPTTAARLGEAGRRAAAELMDPQALDAREQAVYAGLTR